MRGRNDAVEKKKRDIFEHNCFQLLENEREDIFVYNRRHSVILAMDTFEKKSKKNREKERGHVSHDKSIRRHTVKTS